MEKGRRIFHVPIRIIDEGVAHIEAETTEEVLEKFETNEIHDCDYNHESWFIEMKEDEVWTSERVLTSEPEQLELF